jgi:cytochrome P450
VPAALVGTAAGEVFGQLVRMNDGPAHASLKPAIAHALARFDGHRVADEARRWAEHLAQELRPEADPARIEDFAFRLPVYVVASLLGVPGDLLPQTAASVDDFVRAVAPGATAEHVRNGATAADALLDAVGRPDGAMAANRVGFLSQAYEATAGLIGNTLVALGRHPALRARVLLRAVVREVVRHDPPVQNTRRFFAAAGPLAGERVAPGDTVLVILAAANRDPASNPDPDRFDPFRAAPRMFTFGAGVHACPGERLAVAIARAAIERLLAAGIALAPLAGPTTYRASANARIPLFGAAD